MNDAQLDEIAATCQPDAIAPLIAAVRWLRTRVAVLEAERAWLREERAPLEAMRRDAALALEECAIQHAKALARIKELEEGR